MALSDTESERKDYVKTNPYKFDQVYGCCGFAGILMSLLEHDPDEFETMATAFFNGQKYMDVNDTDKITERLARREAMTDKAGKKWGAKAPFDVKMCVGLMIAFKEFVKEGGKKGVWDDCQKFSENWADWSYGSSLKDDPGGELTFSYKGGDLALPYNSLAWLVSFIWGERARGSFRQVMTNDELVSGRADKSSTTIADKRAAFIDSYREELGEVTDGTGKCILLGVAKNVWAEETDEEQRKKYAEFDYIGHWVYVPQTQPDPEDDLELWTWGRKHKLNTFDGRYTPKTALVLTLAPK